MTNIWPNMLIGQMSVVGQNRKSSPRANVVRCSSNNGLKSDIADVVPTTEVPGYSITSSARCWRWKGTSSPSALAVFRLMINSNLVGCSIGMSAGFVPRKILSTISAARRYMSETFGP